MARLRLPHRAAGALLIVLGALLAGCLEVAPRPAPSAAADAEAAWHQGDFDRAAQAFLELAGADRAQNEGQIRATLQALGADALKREAAALAPGDPLLPWLDQALRAGG